MTAHGNGAGGTSPPNAADSAIIAHPSINRKSGRSLTYANYTSRARFISPRFAVIASGGSYAFPRRGFTT